MYSDFKFVVSRALEDNFGAQANSCRLSRQRSFWLFARAIDGPSASNSKCELELQLSLCWRKGKRCRSLNGMKTDDTVSHANAPTFGGSFDITPRRQHRHSILCGEEWV